MRRGRNSLTSLIRTWYRLINGLILRTERAPLVSWKCRCTLNQTRPKNLSYMPDQGNHLTPSPGSPPPTSDRHLTRGWHSMHTSYQTLGWLARTPWLSLDCFGPLLLMWPTWPVTCPSTCLPVRRGALFPASLGLFASQLLSLTGTPAASEAPPSWSCLRHHRHHISLGSAHLWSLFSSIQPFSLALIL